MGQRDSGSQRQQINRRIGKIHRLVALLHGPRDRFGQIGEIGALDPDQARGLSLEMAADEIGVSRRMLSYYEARKWPVPKTVARALAGWEAQRRRFAA